MTALNKQARLVSSARISEIANGANLIMGEKEWLANTAIYLANELKTATKAFQSTGFSLLEAEAKLEAAENRIAELSGEFFALPPLNDDLIAILGRPNFTCAHLAELLRKGGQDIRRKSEFEQAAVIYWFLDLYLKYGDKWESIAKDDIQSRVAAAGIGVKGD